MNIKSENILVAEIGYKLNNGESDGVITEYIESKLVSKEDLIKVIRYLYGRVTYLEGELEEKYLDQAGASR